MDQENTVTENGIYLYDVGQNIETCILKNNDPEKLYFYSMVCPPDGEPIYYILDSYWNNIDSSSTPVNQLYLVDIYAPYSILSSEQNIFLSENCFDLPGVSPDGETIYISRLENNTYQIYKMDMNNFEIDYITQGRNIQFPPNQNNVFFSKMDGSEYSYFAMDTDGSNIAYICSGTNEKFTPNGNLIIYNKGIINGENRNFSIYSMNTDGTGQKELTTGLDYEISPDSSKIAFLDKYNNEYNGLYVIDIDGSNRRLLTYSEECDIRSINWTPDSCKILFIRY